MPIDTVMNCWSPEKLAELFRCAGAVAIDYFDNPPAELKSDASVVTAADKKIEKLFAPFCDQPEEGVYLIGEETIGNYNEEYIASALASDCCWILDPIDGTAPYSAHLPMWGISLGLLSKGQLIEGAIYLPVVDDFIFTCNGQIMHGSLQKPSSWEPFTVQSSPLGSAGHIAIGQTPAHQWRFDCKNQLFTWSSCVGAFYWLLTGRISAYCGNFKLWDMAGLLPILKLADYRIFCCDDPQKTLTCNLDDKLFELTDSPRRWWVNSPVICAYESSMALNILKQIRQN